MHIKSVSSGQDPRGFSTTHLKPGSGQGHCTCTVPQWCWIQNWPTFWPRSTFPLLPPHYGWTAVPSPHTPLPELGCASISSPMWSAERLTSDHQQGREWSGQSSPGPALGCAETSRTIPVRLRLRSRTKWCLEHRCLHWQLPCPRSLLHTHAHTCTRLKRKLKKAPNTSVPRETPKGVLTPQSLRIMGSISLRRDLKII